jgi:hypothetical protein
MGLNHDLWQGVEEKPDDYRPLLEVEEATVELTVSIEKSTAARMGFQIYVVNAGADTASKSLAAHKVALKLKPLKQADSQSNAGKVDKRKRYPVGGEQDPTYWGSTGKSDE